MVVHHHRVSLFVTMVGLVLLAAACGNAADQPEPSAPDSASEGDFQPTSLDVVNYHCYRVRCEPATQVPAGALRLGMTLDRSRSTAAVVDPSGGVLTATGIDGTVYTLTVPPGALTEPLEIELTPVETLTSVELTGEGSEFVAGVSLRPEGLLLYRSATLVMEPPSYVADPSRELAIASHSGGADPFIHPLEPELANLTLRLIHFSEYNATRASADQSADDPTGPSSAVSEPVDDLLQRMSKVLRDQRAGSDPSTTQAEYEQALADWLPRLHEIVSGAETRPASGECAGVQEIGPALVAFLRFDAFLQVNSDAAEVFATERASLHGRLERLTVAAYDCERARCQAQSQRGDWDCQCDNTWHILKAAAILQAIFDLTIDPLGDLAELQQGCECAITGDEHWESSLALEFSDRSDDGSATVSVARTLDVTFEISGRAAVRIGDALIWEHFTRDELNGTASTDDQIVFDSGGESSVQASGAPTGDLRRLTVDLATCEYRLLLHWAVDGVHQPSGRAWTGGGGRVAVTGRLEGDGTTHTSDGASSVETHYLVGVPEAPQEFFEPVGFAVTELSDAQGVRFADAEVSWSLRSIE